MRTPCDYMRDENGFSVCPYANDGISESELCRVCCGLGVDEDSYPTEEDEYDPYCDPDYVDEYCPSSTNGDYSPSSPWNAPGMSIRDFI